MWVLIGSGALCFIFNKGEPVRFGLSVHFEMFQIARFYIRKIIATAKSQYYNSKIKECKGNKSTAIGIVKKVFNLNQTVLKHISAS